MRDGRPAKSEPDILRHRFWAYHLLHYANEAYAAGRLKKKLSAPPSWASIERLLAKSSKLPGAAYGRLQGLERVARFGHDPSKIVRRVPERDWIDAGIKKPKSPERRTVNGTEICYAVIKLDLVELAELKFPGSKTWYDAEVWALLNWETMSPRDVEQITEHCLGELGLFRTHLNSVDSEPFNPKTSKNFVFSRRPRTVDELIEAYIANLLPLAQVPTPNGLSLLTSMLFEASYLTDELLTEIHADLLEQALKNLERRNPLGEPVEQVHWEGDPSLVRDQNLVGILSSAIFDAAAEFAHRSLPPARLMSVTLPPRKVPRADSQ